MPYEKTSELPTAVKSRLPAHAKRIFMSAFNAALEQYGRESTAFKVAWAAVKKQFSPGKDGKWEIKKR